MVAPPSTAARIIHSAVDDLYFSALSAAEEEINLLPISDDRYAEELQFQEVLMMSLLPTASHALHRSCATPPQALSLLSPPPEKGECSNSSAIFCEICADTKAPDEMFHSSTCRHLFCKSCIGQHIAAKVRDNIIMILCPDVNCNGVLEQCRDLVPL